LLKVEVFWFETTVSIFQTEESRVASLIVKLSYGSELIEFRL